MKKSMYHRRTGAYTRFDLIGRFHSRAEAEAQARRIKADFYKYKALGGLNNRRVSAEIEMVECSGVE